MTTTASTAMVRGRFCTVADHFAARPLARSASGPWAASRRRCRRLSTRGPSRPSSAGSRVTAASTLSTTVSEVPMTTPSRKRRLVTSIPASAMHTVPPANSTARPEL